jgi:HAD superfamily hydrolase (TIGR01509 family)
MALRGLIFDFDGLILDTETTGFQAWLEIFQRYNLPFTYADWAKAIGTGPSAYDPALDLCAYVGEPLDPAQVRTEQLSRVHEILETVPPLPGVLEFLRQAKEAGLHMAVASSSPCSWVEGHLKRLNLASFFDCVLTAEDVERVKPSPDLFLLAMKKLGVQPHEAIVFEDSPNGITAARAAGIYVIAIPNNITETMDISHTDKKVTSFTEISLQSLIHQFEAS